MSEPVGHRERRPWTEEEDRLLRLGIEREDPGANPPTKWHAIANHVPNRTNKDCRKRWWAQMATTVAKGGWSADEDERLCNAVEEYGTKWALVAKHVQTRNSGQCAKRWNDALNPAIDRSEWTEEEDIALIEAVKVQGKSWTNIVRAHLPGRTGLAAKNRYNHLTRATSDRTKNRERRTSSAAAPYSATRTTSIVPPPPASTDSTPPRSSRDGSPTGSYHSPYPHPGGMPLKKEDSNYQLGYPRDPRRDTLSLTHPPEAYAPHLNGMPPNGGSNGMYPPPMPSQYPYPQQPPVNSSYPPGQGPSPNGGPGYFQGGQGSYHSSGYAQPPLSSNGDQHAAQYSAQHYLPPPAQYGRYGPGYDSAHPPGTKALDGYSRAQSGAQHPLPPSASGFEHRQAAYDGQQTPTQQPVKQEVAAGMVNQQQMW